MQLGFIIYQALEMVLNNIIIIKWCTVRVCNDMHEPTNDTERMITTTYLMES